MQTAEVVLQAWHGMAWRARNQSAWMGLRLRFLCSRFCVRGEVEGHWGVRPLGHQSKMAGGHDRNVAMPALGMVMAAPRPVASW